MKMFESGKSGRLFKGAAVAGLLWMMACVGMMMQAGNGVAWAAKGNAAQTDIGRSPQEIIDSLKNRGYDVSLRKEGDVNVYVIKSVAPFVLTQLANQQVEVTGIINGFSGIKQRYRFTTNDQSAVIVNGPVPDVVGTHWTLRASVIQNVAQVFKQNSLIKGEPNRLPILYEVHKTPFGSGGNPNLWIIIAGIVLILIALGVLGAVMMRKKMADDAQQNQAKLDQIAADNAAKEAAQKAAIAGLQNQINQDQKKGKNDGDDRTVVRGDNSGGGDKTTIRSIGALKCTSGVLNGNTFPLIDGTTRIGHAKSGNDIVLDQDKSVSRSHGSIIATADGRVIFKDESTNGTTVDGQLISHNQVDLRSGSKLEIGGSTFEVALPRAGNRPAASVAGAPPAPPSDPRNAPTMKMQAPVAVAPAATPAAPPSAPAPAPPTAMSFGAELEILDGPEKGRHIPITKTVTTLGREGRDVLLSEDSVSRRHATLHFQDGKFVLADDGSGGGTKVNGESVGAKGCELHDKDEITFGVGNTKVRFRSINS